MTPGRFCLALAGLLAGIGFSLTPPPLARGADQGAPEDRAKQPPAAEPLAVLPSGGRMIDGTPFEMAVSPDGTAVAVIELRSRGIQVFEGPGWMTRRMIQAKPRMAVNGMAFSADGSKLIAWTRGNGVVTLDARTGEMLNQDDANGVQGAIQEVAFSADAGRAVISTSHREAVLYDVTAGKVLQKHRTGKFYRMVAISDDGTLWATADGHPSPKRSPGRNDRPEPQPRPIVIRSADGNETIGTIEGVQATGVAAFGPKRQWLAAIGQEGQLVLIDLREGAKLFRCLETGGPDPSALAFSPDGSKVIVAVRRGQLAVFDLATERKGEQPEGTELTDTVRPAAEPKAIAIGDFGVRQTAFTPDGRRILAACDDGWLRIYDPASGKEVDTPPGHLMPVSGAALLPGAKLVTADISGRVLLRQLPDGTLLARRQLPMGVYGLAVSPSRDRVAVSTQHGGYVWPVDSNGDPTRLKATQPRLGGGGWEGQRRARGFANVTRYDRTTAWAGPQRVAVRFQEGIYWYDPNSGDTLGRINPAGQLGAISLNGRFEAVTTRDRAKVMLRSAEDGRMIATIKAPSMQGKATPGRPVRRKGVQGGQAWTATAVSHGGQWLLNASHRAGLVVQDALTGDALWSRQSDGDFRSGLRRAVFCADRPLLALGNRQGRTEVINLLNGKTILAHDGSASITALAFSPGGRHLVAGAADGSAIVWPLPEVKLPAAEADRLDELYTQLTAEEAKARYRVTWAMVGLGDATVAYLAEKLQPQPATDEADSPAAKVIAQLDAPKYAQRAEAAEKLRALGPEALPAIRKALAAGPSAETRNRLQKALDRLAQQTRQWQLASAETRAIGVLRRIATPRARKLLSRLAGGADNHPLTRRAKEAWADMGETPPADPIAED